MAFASAEDRVDEDSFEAILTVLGGDSAWRDFLRPACAAARKNIPERPFRVVPQAEYATELAKLDKKATPNDTPGVTNKRDGIIWMQGYFGTKSREAMLGHSLHEAVHLVSHIPGRAGKQHSTAMGVLGDGILEGLVECVTTNILNTQKIALADPGKRGHQQRVPVVQELISTYRIGIPILGCVLFRGDTERFFRLMESAFTTAGWLEVQRLATSNNPDGAKRRMGELRAAEEKAHPGNFKSKLQQAAPTAINTPAPYRSPPPSTRYS
ncbi:MAG TPA: hypothetical protein VG692_16395 [Gemmatimonadales bacterium]|nr:hypothetical protein [Gemmatimonadales bacterium]